MNVTAHPTRSAISLRLFMHSDARHDGMPLHEWLLQLAKREKLAGGSVFRAIGGFGRHGVLHDETFFELPGKLPLMTLFILAPEAADRLLQKLREAGVELAYTRTPVEFGVLGSGQDG